MNIGDIRIMREAAGPQTDPRGTAECRGYEMVIEGCALVSHMLESQWSVCEGIQLEILIIRHDKEEVGRLAIRALQAIGLCSQCLWKYAKAQCCKNPLFDPHVEQ
jgi:hypothetical protein